MPKAKRLPAGRQVETIKVTEPPKIPTLNFGKKPAGFGSNFSQQGRPAAFVAPKMRVTQSKGAGSGK